MSEASAEDPRSKVYQHVKTGGLYVVIINDAMLEKSIEQYVVYRSLKDGQVWIRPWVEFWDGRFKCISKADMAEIAKVAASIRKDF